MKTLKLIGAVAVGVAAVVALSFATTGTWWALPALGGVAGTVALACPVKGDDDEGEGGDED
jgi:hypothetical protein